LTQIVIAIILAFLLQLAIWEGLALGAAWLINTFTTVEVSYVIAGGIIFVLWLAQLAIRLLAAYGAYKERNRL
jgi:hypothetical protein